MLAHTLQTQSRNCHRSRDWEVEAHILLNTRNLSTRFLHISNIKLFCKFKMQIWEILEKVFSNSLTINGMTFSESVSNAFYTAL